MNTSGRDPTQAPMPPLLPEEHVSGHNPLVGIPTSAEAPSPLSWEPQVLHTPPTTTVTPILYLGPPAELTEPSTDLWEPAAVRTF